MEEILNFIIKIDITIFYFINNNLKNPVLDFLMPIITNVKYWIFPLLVVLVVLFIFGKKEVKIAIILGIIVVVFVDFFCYRVVKPFIGRIRPFYVLPHVYDLVNAGYLSFPSNHAANSFALATIVTYFSKKIGVCFIILSCIIGFSRIYVGVHYPFDVIGGMIIGFLFGVLGILVYKTIENIRKQKK
ncbi:MAG: phosphatase PAP2 family protein [Candidatus Firestonebacteria bacterium]